MRMISIVEKLDKKNCLIYIYINKIIWIKRYSKKRTRGDKNNEVDKI